MIAPSPTSEAGRPLLVGRERQLAHVRGLLQSGGTRLILTAVGAGLGQTTFLKAVDWAARELGWDAAREDGEGELVVTPVTTRDSFTTRVREALGIPLSDALAPEGGDFEPEAVRRSHGSRRESGPVLQSNGRTRLDPLVEQLWRRPGRPVILVDGYRPSAAFAEWFHDEFVRDLLQRRIAAVILVADLPEMLESLQDLPHEHVQLGRLDRHDVVRFFEELRAHADPPLADEEIQRFADETLARPELFAALRRLLTLPAERGSGAAAKPIHAQV